MKTKDYASPVKVTWDILRSGVKTEMMGTESGLLPAGGADGQRVHPSSVRGCQESVRVY